MAAVAVGLRRGEVLGLRWSDIDLKKGTLKVQQTRVLVDYQVVIEAPKSRNGFRTLPFDEDETLMADLKALRKRQQAEAEEAGEAYDASGYVVTDELGAPVHPEWYSDEFGRILRSAKLRRITLHDSRHTTLSLMEKAGVPISVISKWAGHYDSAFTQSRYVHANGDDLAKGAEKLARVRNCETNGPQTAVRGPVSTEVNRALTCVHTARPEGFEPPTF